MFQFPLIFLFCFIKLKCPSMVFPLLKNKIEDSITFPECTTKASDNLNTFYFALLTNNLLHVSVFIGIFFAMLKWL